MRDVIGRLFARLIPRVARGVSATPRLDEVLTAKLPEGTREAMLLVERSIATAPQPLNFSPEDLAKALAVRLSWLAREMDQEGRGEPGSLSEPHLERLEEATESALDKISPLVRDSYQMLYLLGLMVIHLVERHEEGEV